MLFSVAVRNTIAKDNLGKKGFISSYSGWKLRMELKAEVWSRVHGETLLPIAGSATCLIQPRYTCLDMIAYTVGLGKCPTGIPQSDRGNSLVKCPSSEVCRIDNQNYLKCNFLSVIWCFENWPWGSAISGSGVMNYPAAVQLQIVLHLQWVFLQLGRAPLRVCSKDVR